MWSPDGTHIVTASSDKTARYGTPGAGCSSSFFRDIPTELGRGVEPGRDAHPHRLPRPHGAGVGCPERGPARLVAGRRQSRERRVEPRRDPHRHRLGRGTARVWDARNGTQLMLLQGHTDASERGVEPRRHPDRHRLRATRPRGCGTQKTVINSHCCKATPLWSDARRGARKAAGSSPAANGSARVWDAKSGAQLALLQGRVGLTESAWSPDGSRIATASQLGGSTRVWDAASGAQLVLLQGFSPAWSPDGNRIVTTLHGAHVWDTKSGVQLMLLRAHNETVSSATWSPDGNRIVTASVEKSARIWDAESGAQLALLQGHTDGVTVAAWSPDGSRILTASWDKTARVWNAWPLLTDDTVTYAVISAVRTLTDAERAAVFVQGVERSSAPRPKQAPPADMPRCPWTSFAQRLPPATRMPTGGLANSTNSATAFPGTSYALSSTTRSKPSCSRKPGTMKNCRLPPGAGGPTPAPYPPLSPSAPLTRRWIGGRASRTRPRRRLSDRKTAKITC